MAAAIFDRWFSGSAQEDEAVIGWRVSFSTACLIIVGELLAGAIGASQHGLSTLQLMRICEAGWAGSILCFLFLRRARFTASDGGATFLLLLLPVLAILWQVDSTLMAAGKPLVLFGGNKQVMLGIAILAPTSLWLGGALVVAFALESMLSYHYLHMAGSPVLAPGEPWMTLLYGLLALGLLVHRTRHRVLEQQLYRSRAEVDSLEQRAQMLLALRDRANTPLQTLELAHELILRRYPDAHADVERMRNAVQKLRELSATLAGTEHLTTWRKGGESFDSNQILRPLARREKPDTE